MPVLTLSGVLELGMCLEAEPRMLELERWVGEIERYSEAIDKLRE